MTEVVRLMRKRVWILLWSYEASTGWRCEAVYMFKKVYIERELDRERYTVTPFWLMNIVVILIPLNSLLQDTLLSYL